MQVRLGRVKVSGFHLDTAVKVGNEGDVRCERRFFLKAGWYLRAVFSTAVDRRQTEPGTKRQDG